VLGERELTRWWDGLDKEILMEQETTDADAA
jgi:hypothetical protein